MFLYALVVTFYVGSTPQSIEIGRYDPGFCNDQAERGNRLFRGIRYRCIPAGPFSGDKSPQ